MTDQEIYDHVAIQIRKKAKDILPHVSTVAWSGSIEVDYTRSDSGFNIQILLPRAKKLGQDLMTHLKVAYDILGLELKEGINAIGHTFATMKKRCFSHLIILVNEVILL